MTSTTMYANLTTSDLYELHTQLSDQTTAIYRQMIAPLTPDGPSGADVALIDPLSKEWADKSAEMAHIGWMMDSVSAEIQRRELELTPDPEPLTHVEMVCTACRTPVTETFPGHPSPWVHKSGAAVITCPVGGTHQIKAMVAAGNESVPRA